MKNTKKFVSVVLAFCMLGTTTAVTSMAATTDAETVSGGSVAVDTTATKALEELDANYRYDGDDLGVTYTKDATTFKVWSPTATDIKVNIFTKGSDDEQGATKPPTNLRKKTLQAFGRLSLLANGKTTTTPTQSQ